jgi:hypothetical protein
MMLEKTCLGINIAIDIAINIALLSIVAHFIITTKTNIIIINNNAISSSKIATSKMNSVYLWPLHERLNIADVDVRWC